MKKAIIITVIVVLLVGVGILQIHVGWRAGESYQAEAKDFVEKTTVGLFSNWDPQEMYALGTDDLKRNQPIWQVEGICQTMRNTLGPLKTYYDAEGEVRTYWMVGQGKAMIGHYEVDGQFAFRRARITMTVIRENSQWHLAEWEVNYGLTQ